MLLRVLATIAGLAVIAAATDANIKNAGGYGSSDTFLIIAVAVLLSIGTAYATIELRDGSKFRKIGAASLVVCLLAGEAYWLLLNVDRELQRQNEREEPFARQKETWDEAQQRVTEAKEAKKKADDAALSQAALQGCKTNCAQLLTTAKREAAQELTNAENALARLPHPKSATALADNIGMSRWAWHLLMGALRGLAVVGGSIAVALAIHPRRQHERPGASRTIELEPVKALPASKRGGKQASRPRRRPVLESAPLAIAAPAKHAREHVSHFVHTVLRPDPDATTSLRELLAVYPAWCSEQGVDVLEPEKLTHQLRSIIDAIGLHYEPPADGDVVIRGARLDPRWLSQRGQVGRELLLSAGLAAGDLVPARS
jgi:hypothetical protein